MSTKFCSFNRFIMGLLGRMERLKIMTFLCSFYKFLDHFSQKLIYLLKIYFYYVRGGVAESGGVKRGISLETLCSCKWTKSNPPLKYMDSYLTLSRCQPLVEKILVHRQFSNNQLNWIFTCRPCLSCLIISYEPELYF